LEWSQPASAGPFGAILYPFEVALGRMRSEGSLGALGAPMRGFPPSDAHERALGRSR